MPITTKAGPMPTHQRLGTDDREDLQDRREPSVQLDKKPAIVVRQLARPLTLRRKTVNWCRSAAFSASSRLFDLNGEARMARTKWISQIIAPT